MTNLFCLECNKKAASRIAQIYAVEERKRLKLNNNKKKPTTTTKLTTKKD